MDFLSFDVIVIGSGAAGFNAANRIKEDGKLSVAMVTEAVNCGTSRNTGSDKQTYYKLNIGGETRDSVRQMASDLFAGGSVDGDNALCEAALSVRSFMNLCELGVAFPTNRYGEYIGYKTDHDPYARATSAGPLTSKYMTEALQRRAKALSVEILSGYLAIEVLKNNDGVLGILCVEIESGKLLAIKSGNIIIATGGPAGIYADSVYPICHTGSTGLALKAGAMAQNLTEWQYGLASVNPRWNVSGTYMQVLPRFVSVDNNGTEYEFLSEYFDDVYEALSAVFLKGYQWPFDSKKVLCGSSVIDLLVYRESVLRKRKVYLDFTKNPFGLKSIEFKRLSSEAYEYLEKANALFGSPIERLFKMNSPAVELYRSKGIDISEKYLEIALCAQHNNGGISVDTWWQTNIHGLFAAGECAGTHGISRPGGSALNAGQVGSLRAAQYICRYPRSVDTAEFEMVFGESLKKNKKIIDSVIQSDIDNIDELTQKAQRRMSDNAAAIRNFDIMRKTADDIETELSDICKDIKICKPARVYKFYKLYDILLTQRAVIAAFLNYAEVIGDTRGSALYYNKKGELRQGLEEVFRFTAESGESVKKIQETFYENGAVVCKWRSVRPIPESNDFFENVWKRYREDGNIY